MKIFNGKRFGFTLTELMVAMTILGVIAALTVPSLKRDYTRRQFQTAISKFYSDMLQVAPLSQVTSGYNELKKDPAFTTNNDWPEKYLRAISRGNYAKAPQSGKTNGFADSYRTIDNSSSVARSEFCDETGSKTFALDNGYVVCSTPNVSECNDGVRIFIDINGSKSPNIAGLDLFTMCMDTQSEGDIEGYRPSHSDTPEEDCKKSAIANGCFTSILNNDFKITYY